MVLAAVQATRGGERPSAPRPDAAPEAAGARHIARGCPSRESHNAVVLLNAFLAADEAGELR